MQCRGTSDQLARFGGVRRRRFIVGDGTDRNQDVRVEPVVAGDAHGEVRSQGPVDCAIDRVSRLDISTVLIP